MLINDWPDGASNGSILGANRNEMTEIERI